MRISDWSSDVCSSDLDLAVQLVRLGLLVGEDAIGPVGELVDAGIQPAQFAALQPQRAVGEPAQERPVVTDEQDRKSGVQGKSVSVRVDPGGPTIRKKKTRATPSTTTNHHKQQQ